jgi:hypothetical protein
VVYRSASAEITAPWWETVSRTERESYQEPYQESYRESYRARLPSFEDWFARLLAQLDAELLARLAEHWNTSFCQTPSFSGETAARCAFGARPPAAARAELARLFGKDADRVIARFAGATPAR